MYAKTPKPYESIIYYAKNSPTAFKRNVGSYKTNQIFNSIRIRIGSVDYTR